MRELDADAIESEIGWIADDAGDFEAGSIFGDIARAVGKTASTVASPVTSAANAFAKTGVGRGIGKIAKAGYGAYRTVSSLNPAYALANRALEGVASGERVDRAALAASREWLHAAAQGASFVPGLGTSLSVALNAADALADGKPITEAMISAARSALPGGAMAQRAFDSAAAAAKALAAGKRLDQAALEAARAQLPAQAKAAFDTGLALARGQSLQKAILGAALAQAGKYLPPNQVSDLALRSARDIAAGKSLKDVAMGVAKGALPHNLGSIADHLLKNPALRGLPAADIARRLGRSVRDVEGAMGSLTVAARNIGLHGSKRLAPLTSPGKAISLQIHNLAKAGMPMDRMLSTVAARSAPPKFGPNRRRFPGVTWRGMSIRTLQALASVHPNIARLSAGNRALATLRHHVKNTAAAAGLDPEGYTSGLDSSGTIYLVEGGDNPSGIARKLTGNASRYPELFAANPAKVVKNGNWVSLQPGEKLIVPVAWAKASPNVVVAPVATVAPSAPAAINRSRDYIKWVQLSLDAVAGERLSADGQQGPLTTAAIKRFQQAKGLSADGVVGPVTQTALIAAGAQPPPGSVVVPAAAPTPVGFAPPGGMMQVQIMLASWARTTSKSTFGAQPSDFTGAADGLTRAALSAYQRDAVSRGEVLPTDGTLDDATYQSLVSFSGKLAQTILTQNPGAVPAVFTVPSVSVPGTVFSPPFSTPPLVIGQPSAPASVPQAGPIQIAPSGSPLAPSASPLAPSAATNAAKQGFLGLSNTALAVGGAALLGGAFLLTKKGGGGRRRRR